MCCVFYLQFFNYVLWCMCCVRLSYWIKITYLLTYLTRPSGHKKGDFRPCNMVRHDICQHNYAVETGLVVGLCGQPHYCYQPYYPTARFLSPSSSITFLWSWPATDHESHCRHVPINKIWMRTESTPWSGWRIRMGGIYSDCSTRKINKFKGKAPYTNSIQVWSATRRQGPDFQNFIIIIIIIYSLKIGAGQQGRICGTYSCPQYKIKCRNIKYKKITENTITT